MAQPEFLGNGPTPRATDTQWLSLARQLGVLQNLGGALGANNPRRSDTKAILNRKIANARAGTAYPGT